MSKEKYLRQRTKKEFLTRVNIISKELVIDPSEDFLNRKLVEATKEAKLAYEEHMRLKGLKKFIIGTEVIWAINDKTALKKLEKKRNGKK